MMKKTICILLVLCMWLCLSACSKSWLCDQCGKLFRGDAYYDYTGELTLCEDCARTYWMPLPYKNYKK